MTHYDGSCCSGHSSPRSRGTIFLDDSNMQHMTKSMTGSCRVWQISLVLKRSRNCEGRGFCASSCSHKKKAELVDNLLIYHVLRRRDVKFRRWRQWWHGQMWDSLVQWGNLMARRSWALWTVGTSAQSSGPPCTTLPSPSHTSLHTVLFTCQFSNKLTTSDFQSVQVDSSVILISAFVSWGFSESVTWSSSPFWIRLQSCHSSRLPMSVFLGFLFLLDLFCLPAVHLKAKRSAQIYRIYGGEIY